MSEIFNLAEVFAPERTQIQTPDGEVLGELARLADFQGKRGMKLRRFWNIIDHYQSAVTMPTPNDERLFEQAYDSLLDNIVLGARPEQVRALSDKQQEAIFRRFMEETRSERAEGEVSTPDTEPGV